MNLKHFLYGSYWFNQPDPAQGGIVTLYVVILLTLVLVGIIALIVRQREQVNAIRMLLARVGAFGFTMGLTGLLLFWFRQESIFFLGWRLWYLVWFIIMALWLGKLLKYSFKRLPIIKAEHAARMQKEKYLPKR